MPKKTIIIFITTFVLVGIIILGFYFWFNRGKDTSTTGESTPWYQNFNPFGTGSSTTEPIVNPDGTTNEFPGQETIEQFVSKFYQITDFAVAGATFLEDTRPIDPNVKENINAPQEIKIQISPDTKQGRMDIQKILNEKLLLKPALVLDGSFGKKAEEAIKAFQKLNNLPITGKIDIETAPFFIKVSQTTITENNLFEEAPSIRYVERMNGHIYKMFLDTKNKEKISNSTIPNIYEAFFDSTAKTVIYRYLSENKSINSFLATIGAPKGEFLPQNVSDVSLSRDKNKFFYLSNVDNESIGMIETFGISKKEIVFNSSFTEWLSQWDNNQNIYLTTKPSYGVLGNIFKLNTTNKTILKVFGNLNGLTTLVNPNGSLVLYNSTKEKGPGLEIFDISKHTSKSLNIYGLSEKCVWSLDNINIYCAIPNKIEGNQYPDIWYQGLVSFNDSFVKINTINTDVIEIANSIKEIPIDGTNLFLDKTENNLFFINKKDSSLWGLSL